MPERETLETFAASGATLALHLSVHALERIVAALLPHYGPDCPVAIVCRASWPEEQVVRGTLSSIENIAAATPMERTATILVGPVLAAEDFRESALYDAEYRRRFREGSAGCD